MTTTTRTFAPRSTSKNRNGLPLIVGFLLAASAGAQNTAETHGAMAQPRARVIVNPPNAEALSRGQAVIPFRAQNIRIVPVFGSAALAVSPPVGHLHVNVDDASWVWAHASEEPVIVVDLAVGKHKVRVQLMNANHQELDSSTITFAVPEPKTASSGAQRVETPATEASGAQSAIQARAKILVDSPAAEPLSRGVIFFRYRTENLDVAPVFGLEAALVSPRIGHVLVRVDGTPWRWVDGNRTPIIVQGLTPGTHRILVELADANHQVIDEQAVDVALPDSRSSGQASRDGK